MTSELRSLSQIPARMKYLYAVGSTNAWVPTGQVNTILNTTQFASGFSTITDIPEDSLMRDLGKMITVVNTSGQHIAVLRLVQTVDGPFTEGVPDNWNTQGQYYISTWCADPTSQFNVTVTRTG
jgi:hypothetical protein